MILDHILIDVAVQVWSVVLPPVVELPATSFSLQTLGLEQNKNVRLHSSLGQEVEAFWRQTE